MVFFTEPEQITLKLVWKHKTTLRAQKQSHRSIEKNKKPRHQPTFIWAINTWQREQEHIVVERQPPQ